MVSGRRRFLALVLWSATAAGAAVPGLALESGREARDLVPHMATERVAATTPPDPNVLWQGGAGERVPPAAPWILRPGETWVGRVTLRGGRERDLHVLQLPAPQLDTVQVWYRREGGTWRSALAGDRVPLSRWPFPAQFAAFPIQFEGDAVDVIVAATNESHLVVPVYLVPDEMFRASQVRRANLSGVMTGLATMVVIVCVLGALVLRGRSHWLLAGVSLWTLLTIASGNGYLAVWLTGEWPAFNDGARHFFGVVMGGLLVALTVEALDPRFVQRGQRILGIAFPLLALAYAVAQLAWFPSAWRPLGGLGWVALSAAVSAALTTVNALRGGRFSVWIAAAVASMALVVLAALLPADLVRGLDLRAAFIAMFLSTGLLLFRQALVSRDRHGRDVLGRDAISAHRDPLTALLSAAGFEQAWEEAVLRQEAGTHGCAVILIELAGLRAASAEHGFILAERALVRLAAAVHAALGPTWAVARLGENHLACLDAGSPGLAQVQSDAMRVLTRCTRLTQPFPVVAALDIRLACTHRRLSVDGMGEVLTQLSRAATALAAGKRIAVV